MFLIKQHISNVGKAVITFNIIVHDEKTMKENIKETRPTIYKRVIAGNRYMDVTAYPYITIDISRNDDKEERKLNRNNKAGFNRFSLFKLIKALVRLHSEFISIKDLYTYVNNKLTINKDYQVKLTKYVSHNKGKVAIIPSVVPDEVNSNIEHEGIILSINDMSNYVYLTFEDMEYLIFILKSIDFENTTNTLLALHHITSNDNVKEVTITPKIQKISEMIPKTPNISGANIIGNESIIPSFL